MALAAGVLAGVLVWLIACLGMWLALFLLDNLVHLPAGIRLASLAGGLTVMAVLLWRNVLRRPAQARSLDQMALAMEHKFGIGGNLLINAMQLETMGLDDVASAFAEKTITDCNVQVGHSSLKELWQPKRMAILAVAAVCVFSAWTFYGQTKAHWAANALARFTQPLADVPPAGNVALEVTPASDILLPAGAQLRIEVKVTSLNGRTLRSAPQLAFVSGARYVPADMSKASVASMAPGSESGTYSYTFAAVQESVAFRVFAEDTYSRSVAVSVQKLPEIVASRFIVHPPEYTGAKPVESFGPPERLSGLVGSKVDIILRFNKPTSEVSWRDASGLAAFASAGGQLSAATVLHEPGVYSVLMAGGQGGDPAVLASGTVAIVRDEPPSIEFTGTETSRSVYPGERLKVDVTATDDYGVSKTWATMREMREGAPSIEVGLWSYPAPGKSAAAETVLLSLDAGRFRPGTSYLLEAFAGDFAPGGNIGKAQPVVLNIKTIEELTVARDDPAAAAFEALDEAIKAQQAALGVTSNTLANLQDLTGTFDTIRAQLKKKQEAVGSALNKAWDSSKDPRPEFVVRMRQLRDAEHIQVIDKIGKLAGGSSMAAPLGSVARLQQYVLDELVRLKGEVARLTAEKAEKRAAEVLGEKPLSPAESVKDGLKEMVVELKDFTAQQQQIMRERQMLMDKRPEDLTDEDKARLEELALEQSKLAEILKRAVNDFTNLDLQDFGDKAMVEKMTSLYQKADELAQKADAAADQRQARVDAHRLETETVEMAEELQYNMEAVLGFRDNIQFIAETPEDEQLVAPLAELPSELEDLVGDLITKEEEMREEVEDIGSYLNSLDHTAGMVADGTISSTSAKGVTGDQKPEDNVIQGRSGAGRSGMSDGQMVENTAKALPDNEYGLRERTSNTPLESGQVKDDDKKAQTGGTGLGKTTDGATEFGMGGKLPPKVLDMMKAASVKQQRIREATQDVATKLRKHNLPSGEAQDAARKMKEVEDAISKGDSVGIRRAYDQTIDLLGKSREATGRKITLDTGRDEAAARRMDDMLARRAGPRFAGYEKIIGEYFRTLAEAGRSAATGTDELSPKGKNGD
jgi:hypothetical protein